MTFWQKSTVLQMKHSTFAVWKRLTAVHFTLVSQIPKRLMLRMYALKGQ